MSNPADNKTGRGTAIGFWVFTAIVSLHMCFTAYAQLKIPAVAAAFQHLGYPGYFRIELSWAKFAGVAALLIPAVPSRIKEWAYAGFAITFVSAFIAHLSIGDGVWQWIWSVVASVLLAFSYFFWRKLQAQSHAKNHNYAVASA
jgi:DoxX-like family